MTTNSPFIQAIQDSLPEGCQATRIHPDRPDFDLFRIEVPCTLTAEQQLKVLNVITAARSGNHTHIDWKFGAK